MTSISEPRLIQRVDDSAYRAALKVSERLSGFDSPHEQGAQIHDAFEFMEALVRGATADGLCFAEPMLTRKYMWWQDDWNVQVVSSWIAELVEWGEITVEPLGRNCYSPEETFDVIVIQNRTRFSRWWARRSFTAAQRAEVYGRDGGMCVQCGTTERLSVDHIKPWSRGGEHEMWNFQTLCLSCNSRKGNR